MRITLCEGGSLRTARRLFRSEGLRLTVRYGRIYTICAVECRQPNTLAQRRARDVFRRANEAAIEEMRSVVGRLRWAAVARRAGYKSGIGACRAYHVRRLRAEMERRGEERISMLRMRAVEYVSGEKCGEEKGGWYARCWNGIFERRESVGIRVSMHDVGAGVRAPTGGDVWERARSA